MEFEITRASTLFGKRSQDSPCETAYKKDGEEWHVRINTLEELIDFRNKHGNLILDVDGELTIYDDYVE